MSVDNPHEPNVPMKEFRKFYSGMIGYNPTQCHFAYKDKEIRDQDTPESLGMVTSTLEHVF